MSTRRRLAPESRRAELLDAAAAVISARDGQTVRVEDVTAAAGAAKGTFYLYFDSWEAMLVALRERVITDYLASAAERLATPQSPSDWWSWTAREIEAFIDFQVGQGALHRALFHGPISNVAAPAELSAEGFIAALLERGMAEGVVRQVDPVLTAAVVFDLLHGAGDRIAAGADRERTCTGVLDFLRSALEPLAR